MTRAQLERRSIIITIVASGSFGLIGVVISIASQSGAVFLDGVFSLIFAVVGLLTLYVSSLVQRPRDDQYPFGYATFEPMLNLFKGILITLALLYALWSAVTALMTGGQEVAAVGGIVYAAIAVGGGADPGGGAAQAGAPVGVAHRAGGCPECGNRHADQRRRRGGVRGDVAAAEAPAGRSGRATPIR